MADLVRADGDPSTDQVPRLFPYSGTLELDGEAVSGPVEITFSLHDGPASGTLVWFETQDVGVYAGRFSVLLGSCDAPSPPMELCPAGDGDALVGIADVLANADDLYLWVELDAGAGPVILQQSKRFTPVPYARWATNATDFDVARDLDVGGTAEVGGALSVASGGATVSGDSSVTGALSVTGTQSVGGGLSVAGTLNMGAYYKSVGGGLLYCDNPGEVPLSWGADCTYQGHALMRAKFVSNGSLNGVQVSCWHANGSRVWAYNTFSICARIALSNSFPAPEASP